MRAPGLLGSLVLVLLSIFFAHLLAPAVDATRRRVRWGSRQRPIPRAAAILLLYLAASALVVPLWAAGTPRFDAFLDAASATAASRLTTIRVRLARLTPSSETRLAGRTSLVVFDSGVRDMERALDDVAAARRQAVWLLVVPVGAFLLLNHAPAFRRSALRRLPHGHLQWRGDEYLHDVNSAIAGYMRAQAASGAIVGGVCAAGFWAIGVPSPFSLAVAAGLLEPVPVLGPVLVLVLATASGGRTAIAALVFLAALRIVQDYVVYPRLVRRSMHLPTSAVVVAVWIGAAVSGAAGVILAIPAAGFASVSYRHWREYRDIERLVEQVARDRARGTAAATTIDAEPAKTAELSS